MDDYRRDDAGVVFLEDKEIADSKSMKLTYRLMDRILTQYPPLIDNYLAPTLFYLGYTHLIESHNDIIKTSLTGETEVDVLAHVGF